MYRILYDRISNKEKLLNSAAQDKKKVKKMTQLLKTNLAVNLLNSSTSSIFRFFNDMFTIIPKDYKYGKLTVKANTSDMLFVENYNFVYFKSNELIKFSINSVGMLEAISFLFNGEDISIEFTNDSDNDIEIDFVVATIVEELDSDEI